MMRDPAREAVRRLWSFDIDRAPTVEEIVDAVREADSPPGVRPLIVRLTEYRDALRTMADQIEELVSRQDTKGETAEAHDARVSLRTSVDLYRILADDMEKMIAGEELVHWVIMGEDLDTL